MSVGNPIDLGGGPTVGPGVVDLGSPAPAGPGVMVPAGGTRPAAYTHHQDVADTVWIVAHNLGRRPVAWSLYDVDGRHCDEYVVDHPELNRSIIRMDVPTAGTLYLI